MNIAFDGINIDTSYVTGLTLDGKAFNDEDIFKLGSTICRTVILKVSNDLVAVPTNTVTIQGINYCIDSVKKGESETTYSLIDNMVLLNFRYDAEPLINASSHTEASGKKYVTLLELAQDICTKAGITLVTTNFDGYDKHISWYDNTVTAREYIGMIAELNSGYAVASGNNLYFYKYNLASTGTVNIEECSSYEIGEQHTITRIAMDNGIYTPVGTTTGNTIYLNPNNVFITEQADIQRIYNNLNNLQFYSAKANKGNITSTHIDNIGKWITLTLNGNNYLVLNQINANYHGSWNGSYHFIVGSNQQEETVAINGVEDNYTRLKTQVDYEKNQIGLLAETKVDNADYKKSEIIARINNGVGEAVINADCISLAGKTFNLTTDNISISSTNFNVTTDGTVISKAGKIASFNIDDDGFSQSYYPKYNYSQTDVDRIRAILLNQIQPTDEDYEKYDLDNSGTITSRDLLAISKFIIYGISTTNPMNIKIKNGAYVTDSAIEISVGTGQNEIVYTKIALGLVQTERIVADDISAGNIDGGTVNVPDAGITVQFNKTFSSPPVVVITPNTTKAGIIAMKVQNVTTTSFDIAIGGSTYFNGVDTNWIAIG